MIAERQISAGYIAVLLVRRSLATTRAGFRLAVIVPRSCRKIGTTTGSHLHEHLLADEVWKSLLELIERLPHDPDETQPLINSGADCRLRTPSDPSPIASPFTLCTFCPSFPDMLSQRKGMSLLTSLCQIGVMASAGPPNVAG